MFTSPPFFIVALRAFKAFETFKASAASAALEASYRFETSLDSTQFPNESSSTHSRTQYQPSFSLASSLAETIQSIFGAPSTSVNSRTSGTTLEEGSVPNSSDVSNYNESMPSASQAIPFDPFVET